MDEFLTVAEVAALLRLNPQTIRNWVDRIDYAVVDNAHGRVRWPTQHYRPGANHPGSDEIEPPERLTVTAWEMAVVSLTAALDGGGYGTPEDYATRAGITIA